MIEAVIGLIGVIIGCIITYVFTKISEKEKIKNDILISHSTKLIDMLDSFLKNNAQYKYEFSKDVEEFLMEERHSVKEVGNLLTNWKNDIEQFLELVKELGCAIRYLETREVVFNKYVGYKNRLYDLMIEEVNLNNELKDKYINVFFRKGLKKNYIKIIKEYEDKICLINDEINFHIINLIINLENDCYGKYFSSKVEMINDERFTIIESSKKQKKIKDK